jgi:hypothetical protein
MQHLEVSGAVVLYIGRTVSKGKTLDKFYINVKHDFNKINFLESDAL